MNWKDAEYCVKKWNGPFALKGVMSVEDAKRAIDICLLYTSPSPRDQA